MTANHSGLFHTRRTARKARMEDVIIVADDGRRHKPTPARRTIRSPAPAPPPRRQQDPVHLRHVDPAVLFLRRVDDLQARQQAELHRLLRRGVSPGDHRLARHDGGQGRGGSPAAPAASCGAIRKNGLSTVARRGQHHRALAEIVERQRRRAPRHVHMVAIGLRPKWPMSA